MLHNAIWQYEEAECQSVATLPSDQSVATLPSDQSVATLPGDQSVATLPSDQSVATLPSDQSVATLPSDQSVATLPSDQSVATLPSDHHPSFETVRQSTAELNRIIMLQRISDRPPLPPKLESLGFLNRVMRIAFVCLWAANVGGKLPRILKYWANYSEILFKSCFDSQYLSRRPNLFVTEH